MIWRRRLARVLVGTLLTGLAWSDLWGSAHRVALGRGRAHFDEDSLSSQKTRTRIERGEGERADWLPWL
jgi:hypothetical protein